MRASVILVAPIALVTVALSACVGPPPEPDVSHTRADQLWSTDQPTLGEPVLADGALIAYTSSGDGELTLRAWDAATGDELWAQEATPGGAVLGEELYVRTLEVDGTAYVAALSPQPIGHTVVVREAASGAVVELADEATGGAALTLDARSRPYACDAEFCLTAFLPGDAETLRLLRIDPVAGVVSVEAADALPAGVRDLSSGIWSTAGRGPGEELIGRSVGGETAWTRPYTEVFGPGYSSDGGWDWRYDAQVDAFIGLSRPYVQGATSFQLGDLQVAALDAATGETLWKVEHVDTGCQAAHSAPDLWCRYAGGSLTYGEGATGEDLDVSLERFDPATGDVVWSAPLGNAPGAAYGTAGVPLAGSDAAQAVVTADGPVVVDLSDGTVDELAADVVACVRDTGYRYPKYGRQGAELYDYNGEKVVEFCDPDGAAVDPEVIEPALVQIAGVELGDGRFVLATPTGLVAFQLG